jgi:superfamily I DNA and/or RNA helicase
VLLGDPRQLEQPMQGSHPEGTDVSALDHILAGQATIPADRGLFLEETWRLHPDICTFTSELFYENRLQAHPGLERQLIKSTGRIQGAGLRFLPVRHEGNQSSSPEEADKIRELVAEVLGSNSTWTDQSHCACAAQRARNYFAGRSRTALTKPIMPAITSRARSTR